MEATLAVLNDLVAKRLIEKYAIGGAVGAIFWVEPFDTIDLDIFVLLPTSALCTKNAPRALIERPYSREPQAVGAVYDRPGFFVQSPTSAPPLERLSERS